MAYPLVITTTKIPTSFEKTTFTPQKYFPLAYRERMWSFVNFHQTFYTTYFQNLAIYLTQPFIRHSHLQLSHDSNCWAMIWQFWIARTLTCQCEARISEERMQTIQDSTKDNRTETPPEEAVSISEPLKKWISKIQ